MKEIPLALGRGVALVDDEDYEKLKGYNWRLLEVPLKSGKTKRYAFCRQRRGKGVRVYLWMHREIMGISNDLYVDHIDGDGLNNRRSNLRPATPRQNSCNCARPEGKLRGVYYSKDRAAYYAAVKVNCKKKFKGYFDTPEEAAKAYDVLAKLHHGEFAVLNYPN